MDQTYIKIATANFDQPIVGLPQSVADRSFSKLARSTFATAKNRDELLAAFTLLQHRYQQAGLASCDQGQLRIMPHHFSQASQVFVAKTSGRVTGTVTLVGESDDLLPMFRTYPELAWQVGRRYGRIGEVTSLAVCPCKSKPIATFLGLTRLLTFYARHQGLDQLVAIVHPRHAKFYQFAMGFKIIGEVKECNSVGGKPGVAVLGSVNDRHCYRKPWRDVFFEGKFKEHDFSSRPMSNTDVKYFFDLMQQPK